MKISELIAVLQGHLAVSGDLRVETPWEDQKNKFPEPSDVFVTARGTLAINAEC